MSIHRYVTAFALAVWLLSYACIARADTSILVSAAVSLSDALREVGAKFEADNPDVSVDFNFAASGALLRQMELGAPVDVFVSADMRTMDLAKDKDLVLTDTVRQFAANSIVIVVPADSTVRIDGPEDLMSSRVARVSIGNPLTVPAGHYAERSLEAAGAWDGIKDKLVLAENVRQVLDYVRRGEVDAGIVYETDAIRAKGEVRVAARLATDGPVLYPAAVSKTGTGRRAAERFVDYLAGPEAAAVLTRYGFRPAGDLP